MCAVQAGFLGKRVLVLEKNDKVGAKILISGGGRCNYTNLYSVRRNSLFQLTGTLANRPLHNGRLMIPLVFLKPTVLLVKKKP
jgi:hypothetical protein